MAPKFLSFLSNKTQLLSAIASSSGSGDADKIVATDANGKIDRSLLSRIATLTSSSNLTAINANLSDTFVITLTENTTFQNPTGTFVDGQLILINIKSATSYTIAFGTDFEAASSLVLPSATTGSNKIDSVAFRRSTTQSKWIFVGTTIGAYPTAIPSGANTQVQFNDGGAFGGDAGLTYDKTTDALSVTGSVIVPVVAAASSGNVNLILAPIGTGAIQAQVADNTATGGNARGQYAVDLQRVRLSAIQIASGNYSFVVGQSNRASGNHSFAAGQECTASGNWSVSIGVSNSASGNGAFAAGAESSASAIQSTALGGRALARISHQVAMGARIFDPGLSKSQYNIFIAGATTTNATPTVLIVSQDTAQITLQNNSAMRFNVLVIANVTGGGNTSGWELKGVIKRGANAASTALVGTVTTTLVGQNAGASGWAIAATANTTTGGLTITATGQAGTTIRWVATVESAEVAF